MELGNFTVELGNFNVEVFRALLTAALAPIFGKIIGALLFYVAALL